MAHPIGEPSVQVNGVWSGMSPEGIQTFLGQMYHDAGVIPGNRASSTLVKGMTNWSYEVQPCAVFIWKAKSTRLGLVVPIDKVTLTVANPGGAARTDTIYVNVAGEVKVAQGTAAPAGTVVLDRRVIPAGAANTAASTSNWDVVYAVPTGASLGRLAYWQDPGGGASGTGRVVRYTKRFYVPSDRLVRIDLGTTIKSATSTPGAMHFEVIIDGTWTRHMRVAHTPTWNSQGLSWSTGISAGAHTVEVYTAGDGGGTWQYPTADALTEFSMWDMGVDD